MRFIVKGIYTMCREIDLRSPEVVGMLMYLAMYRAVERY